ncbi:MAG: tetratricopeptide repeat protein [Bacteroidetes bacterium]|nr:tetratricopeptide repeat protein [Bacteroidota bacterium]
MKAHTATQPHRFIYRCQTMWMFVLALSIAVLSHAQIHAQGKETVDIARQSVVQITDGNTSLNMSIYGVTLGMPWSDARTILDRGNVPYIFQKGTSPVVYIPPTNSTYYFILNPSSYAVIEMGIIGTADLPLDNQYLFDGHRWRLTTARTQFFGNEGEYVVNEEGEMYNFPFHGFVLKYLTPENFRFVMVAPTNTPLTTYGKQFKPVSVSPPTPPPPPTPARTGPPPQQPELERWLQKFQIARDNFEARRYSTALSVFQEISEQAPDALLRVRSMYWMGETYYGMKRYRDAREQFERVLSSTDIETLRAPAKLMINKCNRFL